MNTPDKAASCQNSAAVSCETTAAMVKAFVSNVDYPTSSLTPILCLRCKYRATVRPAAWLKSPVCRMLKFRDLTIRALTFNILPVRFCACWHFRVTRRPAVIGNRDLCAIPGNTTLAVKFGRVCCWAIAFGSTPPEMIGA